MPRCLFCTSEKNTPSYLPDTHFNNHTFQYLRCNSCGLIYLDPFPSDEDYKVMYPPTYQAGANPQIIPDDLKLPGLRFPYGKHYELIERYAPGKKLADYGCGHANFVVNVMAKGYSCDGVEFNPDHIKVLKEEVKAADFYSIPEFLADLSPKYDLIRLSYVLEHLDHPLEITRKLIARLNPGGVLLIEGPIETNPSLAFWVRKMYFKLVKNKAATHSPTHIFFSNARNQRDFFKKAGLDELHFEVAENEWPFPENLKEAAGIGGKFKWTIAKISRALQHVFKKWGNTFIYIGRRNNAR